MTGARAVSAVVAYLRHGQPSAAPSTGYCPLLALAPRRPTDSEIGSLAAYFATQSDDTVSDVDIATAVMRVTDNLANDTDVQRIRREMRNTR